MHTTWSNLLAVGLGGCTGSLLRYLIAGWVQRGATFQSFPWGTLAVNGAGCLAIGALAAVGEVRPMANATKLFLFVGLLGGFTTFSAFGNETLELLRQGHGGRALTNVALQLALGLGATWLGWTAVRAWAA